jgi:hypothetical protein
VLLAVDELLPQRADLSEILRPNAHAVVVLGLRGAGVRQKGGALVIRSNI